MYENIFFKLQVQSDTIAKYLNSDLMHWTFLDFSSESCQIFYSEKLKLSSEITIICILIWNFTLTSSRESTIEDNWNREFKNYSEFALRHSFIYWETVQISTFTLTVHWKPQLFWEYFWVSFYFQRKIGKMKLIKSFALTSVASAFVTGGDAELCQEPLFYFKINL